VHSLATRNGQLKRPRGLSALEKQAPCQNLIPGLVLDQGAWALVRPPADSPRATVPECGAGPDMQKTDENRDVAPVDRHANVQNNGYCRCSLLLLFTARPARAPLKHYIHFGHP
jgi:hypothetical protein